MAENIIQTSQVYGVSNETIATYVERSKVDDLFVEGLKRNKHIIVYGASKQGKTSLTNKHLKDDQFIRVNCSHNTLSVDLYKSIIRQLDIEFEESREITTTFSGEQKFGMKASVKIPVIGGLELTGQAGEGEEKETAIRCKTIEFNLELAQDISELLRKIGFNKRIIIENFHYLNDDTQKQLAYDLRIFEDYNLLFIVLGIWREKNRLAQFNGDLLDRLIEIPVEPWEKEDLKRVIKEGEPLLNVSFNNILDKIIETSFDSVGVLQELCKETCYSAGLDKTSDSLVELKNEHLNKAVDKKLIDYSSRHLKCLEAFVEQKAKSSDEVPLYIPYYFIKVLLNSSFDDITTGFKKRIIQDKIKEIHHRPNDVRPSDIGYFLQTLVSNQIKKSIIPPIFDFDQSTSTIKIIDSTFYFFLRNCNREDVVDSIPIPAGL